MLLLLVRGGRSFAMNACVLRVREGDGDLKRRSAFAGVVSGIFGWVMEGDDGRWVESWSNFLTTFATEVVVKREGRVIRPIGGVCCFAKRKEIKVNVFNFYCVHT